MNAFWLCWWGFWGVMFRVLEEGLANVMILLAFGIIVIRLMSIYMFEHLEGISENTIASTKHDKGALRLET